MRRRPRRPRRRPRPRQRGARPSEPDMRMQRPLVLMATVLSSARASWLITSDGIRHHLLAAADSGPYGPQPFEQQTLSGEVVIDPQVLSLVATVSTDTIPMTPTVGLAEQSQFMYNSCDIRERMNHSQTQGKILIGANLFLSKCALLYGIDNYFTGAAELGAVGVIILMPQFGTRHACSNKFSRNHPRAPPGGIPYFCINPSSSETAPLILSALIAYACEAARDRNP